MALHLPRRRRRAGVRRERRHAPRRRRRHRRGGPRGVPAARTRRDARLRSGRGDGVRPDGDRTRAREGAFVHAFATPSARERWSLRVGDRAVYAVTVRDGTGYVRTGDAVVAFAAGEERWRYPGLDRLAYPEFNLPDDPTVTGTVAPAVTADAVYAPTNGGVVALDRDTGTRRWTADVAHAVAVSVDARRVYVQGYTELRAFAHDGTPRWTRDDVGGLSAPTLAAGAAYAKNGDTLHELDPVTGETRWSFDLRTTILSAPSPVLTDAVVVPSHRTVAVRRGAGLGPTLLGRGRVSTAFDPASFVAPAVGAGHLLLIDPFERRLVALAGTNGGM
ncbi:PQQ-binding-like beta-propeller repeat protein [Haloplanus litoreus]|uniref:outer membrane protein assembly factor BamB family protein n=1 Tax=Haloplanus litoreus TaxID=767515 RepID=UPI00360D53DB